VVTDCNILSRRADTTPLINPEKTSSVTTVPSVRESLQYWDKR
jgi:hypothetical protein